jgi:heme o synthase
MSNSSQPARCPAWRIRSAVAMRRTGGTTVALLHASHPEPSVAVTLVMVALAAATGRNAAGLVAVGAAVLAGQLSVGWLNDCLDAARDRAVGRRDKPVVAGSISARAVGVAAAVAAALCVPLSLLSGVPAAGAHLFAVASGWAYDLGVKASVVSVLPYGVSFGLLPVFVTLGLPGHPLPASWLIAAAALLGSAAHFANALPDLSDDAATGVRGLPHRLGARWSRTLAALLLLAASAILALGPPGPPTSFGLAVLVTAAAMLAAGHLLGRRPGSRAPFRAMLIVALLDVLALIISGTHVGALYSGISVGVDSG